MQFSVPDFKNPHFFVTALTHRSALNESEKSGTTSHESYERLEFLGDAVLELVVTRFLYDKFPRQPEGVLTNYRTVLVRTETLAEVAKELGLDKRLFMSKGEEIGGGRSNPGLLADSFEAVVGALYLDQSLEAATLFINQVLLQKFDQIIKQQLFVNAKSELQEKLQAQGHQVPRYELVETTGPDHAKSFTVKVKLGEQVLGIGSGDSKQRAEQQAARRALSQIHNLASQKSES